MWASVEHQAEGLRRPARASASSASASRAPAAQLGPHPPAARASPRGCGGSWRCRRPPAPACPCRSAGLGRTAASAVSPSASAEAGGEVERAAAAHLALHPDPPAHQLDQPRGDGQPQARAAVPAGRARCRPARTPRRSPPACPAGMPMPVSRDGEVQHDFLVGRCDSGVDVEDAPRPASVNLMALPTRLTTICRSRWESPTTMARHVGVNVAGQFQPLAVGAEGERLQRVAQALAQSRRALRRGPACRPRSWRSRGCR